MRRFQFVQDIEEDSQGRPRRITLRFIRTPRSIRVSEDTILTMAAAQFRYILQTRVIPRYFPRQRRNRNTLFSQIRGYMNMYSTDVQRGHTFSQMRGSDITYEGLLSMVYMVQQSATDLDLTHTEWAFVIAPQLTGAGGRVVSKYHSNKFKETLMEVSDHEGPIPCAAYAIAAAMNPKEKHKWLSEARTIQQTCGWNQYVSVDELKDFVDLYPDYRITCIVDSVSYKHYRNTTFEGRSCQHPSNYLYVVLDLKANHYYAVSSPAQFFCAERNSKDWKFCHDCVEAYRGTRVRHNCEDWMKGSEPERKKQIRKCAYCGNRYYGKCRCNYSECQQCRSGKVEGEHRCIVTNLAKDYSIDDYSIWAYDLECCMEITETTTPYIQQFEKDGNQFTGNISVFEQHITKHKANLVVARNIFTNEERIFQGDHCLAEFLHFCFGFNQGKNIFVAHNASGYDSRLLFDTLITMDIPVMNPLMRGTKMVKLQVGKTKFIDSLLHLPGSLRALAKDFCSHVQLEKGYFPHLFNSISNYNYVGPIPDIKYFDLSFVIKDDRELHDFYDWYETWQGRSDWCFQAELLKYCKNDVLVLSNIMLSYHNILVEKTDIAPWFYTTAPSFVHAVYLRHLAMTLELPDRKEDPAGYAARITELAEKEYWCVLTTAEYTFARKALRGGRTDIRKVYHHVTDEEWNQGIRIRYQDICSQYPYQQAVHDFPVGRPSIYVWDSSCYPCNRSECTRQLNCPGSHSADRRCHIITDAPIPTAQELIRDESWFGIVCCSVQPPKNMYHPILVHFDEQMNKSVASCKPIIKGVFTSIELKKALEHGYHIIQLHRFDKYHKKPSLWADTIKDFFIEKMINSENLPSPENQERLIQDYEARFGMGDALRKTFQEQKWKDNPAKKKAFKIMLNSGWGKHAQRPDLMKSTFIEDEDIEAAELMFHNISANNIVLKGVDSFGSKTLYRTKISEDYEPDVHNSYLPAALFVPAYGRLHLWEQLHRLGKRVLMNDTDSVVYVYDPKEYNIPQGDVWGEWEVEKDDVKNGGIRTFVGLGPKTYAFRCENGKSFVKCKGLALKHSTQGIVNFESMQNLIQTFLHSGDIRKLQVPQMTFDYKLGKGISTRYMLKQLCFNSNDLKGTLDSEGYLYPFGYE